MKRALLVGVGVLITVAGVIFTLQGLGAIGGSAMSGVTFWAVAGPVIALAGLAMAAIGLRRRLASLTVRRQAAPGRPGAKIQPPARRRSPPWSRAIIMGGPRLAAALIDAHVKRGDRAQGRDAGQRDRLRRYPAADARDQRGAGDEPVHRAGHRRPQPATGHIAMPGAASRAGRPAVPAFRKLDAVAVLTARLLPAPQHRRVPRVRRVFHHRPARNLVAPPSLFSAASGMGLPRTTARRSG